MNDLPKIPVEAKEIIKHKRTGKVYASKEEFDADVADPNTDTTIGNWVGSGSDIWVNLTYFTD